MMDGENGADRAYFMIGAIVVAAGLIMAMVTIFPGMVEEVESSFTTLLEEGSNTASTVEEPSHAEINKPTDTITQESNGESLEQLGMYAMYLMGLLVVGVVILTLIGLGVKKLEAKAEARKTTVKLNGTSLRLELDGLNRMVVVGEDNKEGKVGSIRRLYTLLHVTREGNFFIDDKVRNLRSEEKYKEGLCQDVPISETEWDGIKQAYIEISEGLQLRYTIEKSNAAIEANRKKLIKEQELKIEALRNQEEFIAKYREENGYQQLPAQLMKESERLESELKTLDNELDLLGKEYQHLAEDYTDTLVSELKSN